jgi:hypothetical protein
VRQTNTLLVLLLWPALLRADGGAVRFSGTFGSHQVAVFTSPTPLRAGWIDVSVLVQDPDTGRALSNVPVQLRAYPVANAKIEIAARATREAATNKLFQAAALELPLAGPWCLEVRLGDSAPLHLLMDVAEPLPPWLHLAGWIAWPFALVGLFLVHQVLSLRRGANHSSIGRR